MDDTYLDVTQAYTDECKITQMQYHSFLPYSSMALSNNDKIEINIQNMDAYTLPCESYIYIEGKINKPVDASTGKFNFANNGLAFLFSEAKYELNGTEIQKIKNPGITSCLKGYCSYTPSDMHILENMAWDINFDDNENKTFMENTHFSGCIPMKHLFGFCEDYNKILLNCNQQLILNRSSTDYEALRVVGKSEDIAKYRKVSVELSKVIWKMPIVKVGDREKLRLMRVLDSRKPLSCAFRTWDLCEYPILPQNTAHSWTVKSSSLLEKPRFVIFGLQTDRKTNLLNSSGRFDDCKLLNFKVHLNSEVFPHENFRSNFADKITSVLYKAYADFQKSYYEKDRCEPLLPKRKFDSHVPIVVVDLSRQNDNVKSSSVDLRLEFETSDSNDIPQNTSAYCLILHDQIITYSPFNGEVRKI